MNRLELVLFAFRVHVVYDVMLPLLDRGPYGQEIGFKEVKRVGKAIPRYGLCRAGGLLFT